MSSSQDPRLYSSITLEHRNWWFVTIEYYHEEFVLSGWTWTGFVTERLPMDEVAVIEKWTVTHGPNFRFHTTDSSHTVFGRIHKHAKFWKLALEKDDRVELKLRS